MVLFAPPMKLEMKYLIVCAILLLSFGTLNAQTGEKIITNRSPSGNIVAEHYFTLPDELRRIFLRETGSNSKPILLVSYNRDAQVLFSPDEKWLILNDNPGSNISEVRLFKRIRGLHYQEVTDAALHAKVWELFDLRHMPHNEVDYLHSYTYAICWGPTSDKLLIEIRADGLLLRDKLVVQFGPWRCVYNIKSTTATDDPQTLLKFQTENVLCK